MVPLSVNDLVLIIAAALFLLGIIAIGGGVLVLVSRVMNDDLKQISDQTAQLAKKGMAEDISGLVGNASALVDSLNQLVRTSSGIGIFLVLTGFVLVASAYFLLLKIQ